MDLTFLSTPLNYILQDDNVILGLFQFRLFIHKLYLNVSRYLDKVFEEACVIRKIRIGHVEVYINLVVYIK